LAQRSFQDSRKIETVGEFMQYDTRAQAEPAIKRLTEQEDEAS
jgi:hypothetical protein